jgi:hypothetical protein
MTGTRLRGMDAAGTAWWRWGTHAAGPRHTGNAEDLATRAWEDAEMARGRQGRQRNAMMETMKTGTDVAEHVRFSAAGSVRGEMHLVQIFAVLFLSVGM